MPVNQYQNRLLSVDGAAPASMTEAIGHLNLPPGTTFHRPEVQLLLDAAEEAIQRYGIETRLKTYEYSQWCFPNFCSCNPWGTITLPKQALVDVISVKYIDEAEAEQTVPATDYDLVVDVLPGYIVPVGQQWPTDVRAARPGSVKVVYQAGPDIDRQKKIKTTILQLTSSWFETRSAAFTGTLSSEMELSTRWLMDQIQWGDEFFNIEANWA